MPRQKINNENRKPFLRKHLAHWLCEAITQVCMCSCPQRADFKRHMNRSIFGWQFPFILFFCLRDTSDFSPTFLVSNVLDDHWQTVGSWHITHTYTHTHTQALQAAMHSGSLVTYLYEFFGTATVRNDHPYCSSIISWLCVSMCVKCACCAHPRVVRYILPLFTLSMFQWVILPSCSCPGLAVLRFTVCNYHPLSHTHRCRYVMEGNVFSLNIQTELGTKESYGIANVPLSHVALPCYVPTYE